MVVALPRMFRVRQRFEHPTVENADERIREEFARAGIGARVRAGQSVAIAVGSRGIANLSEVVARLVAEFRALGASPFLVPAMGSHGGATAAGQTAVLASVGVTEANAGCPIRSSMETDVIGTAPDGFPVHFDREAASADHVFLCARVKPHTRFVGAFESGLNKMLLIGLGKHRGAEIYHRAVWSIPFERIVRQVTAEVIARRPILGGLAILENAHKELAHLEVVDAGDFIAREPALLARATELLPRIPFDHVDLLVVDEIGKDISGSGMDANVIGRKYLHDRARDDEYPKVRLIAVRGLSPGTAGNAMGIGRADLCLSRAATAYDREKTWKNALTAGRFHGIKIPMALDSDRELLATALPTLGLTPPEEARVVWIENTGALDELECSAAYADAVDARDDLERLCDPRPLPLGGDGLAPNMRDW